MNTLNTYALLLCLCIGLSACGGGGMKGQPRHMASGNNEGITASENSAGGNRVTGNASRGKIVYNKYCILCHGDNGKMKLNGAKDITISKLTYDLRLILIKNGKNLMTPFDGILTDKEIEDVAAYSLTLKP